MSNAEGDLPCVVFETVGEVCAEDGVVVDLGKADTGAEASTEVEGRRCATGCPGCAGVEEEGTGENG